MTGLTVEVDDGETERYGKAVEDLQEDIVIQGNGKIVGTLKYVTGYTGWSGDPDEQEGHYLALTVEADEGETITASIGDRGPVDLTEDGYLVVRITDTSEVLSFTATSATATETKAYDLSELVLEEES